MQELTREHLLYGAQVSVNAIEKKTQLKDIAALIKKEYDRKYPSGNSSEDGVFHCIVGKNFASAVGHETRFYAHLKIGLLHVILFKSKDSPFDVEQGS